MGAKARAWFNRLSALVGVALGIALFWGLPIGRGASLALTVAFLAVVAAIAFKQIPAFDPLGRVRWHLPRGPRPAKRCAITFDDGPSAGTAAVLDVLAAEEVKATFFLLAANARRHPEITRRLVADGHLVAIHGTTHKKLHHASEPEIEAEVKTAIAELAALGAPPAPLYRTPHGLKNGPVFRVARRLGLSLWAWSRGIWDTDRPAPEVLVDRATRFACDGMVLLLHDARGDEPAPDVSPMVAALPRIIAALRARGFTFVTLPTAPISD